MNSSEKLCLKWNDFQSNYCQSLKNLRSDVDFADVTLACDGDTQIEAHKIILSASSPFFMNILKKTKHPHPLLFLKGLKKSLLVSLLDFIYDGEVNIAHEDLTEFLAAAEDLKIKGLSEENNKSKVVDIDSNSTNAGMPKAQIIKPKEVPEILPHSYPLAQSNIKLESYEIEEDYNSIIEYEPEEIQLINDSAISIAEDQALQIESLMERYDGVWTCKACGKTASQKCNIRSHIETHHLPSPISHHCEVCGKPCKSKNALNVHKSTYHRQRHAEKPRDFQQAYSMLNTIQ